MASPPFDPPASRDGRRTAGHVQVPDPTDETAGPLEMSWKVASAGALVEPSPTKLRRTSSIAGNVLVTDMGEDGSRGAYWLQRKITEETHSHNFVRIGFPLKPFIVVEDGVEVPASSGNNVAGAWMVNKAGEGSMYPFDMVAIKVQNHSSVYPEDDVLSEEEDGEDANDKSARETSSKNAKNEISALQLVHTADPDGKGNVLRAFQVVDDQVSVYIIMPYCKEGTLMDQIGASENGRLGEVLARRYFSNILNGLETLQKVKLCHRNLTLENVLMRGAECHLSSLRHSLRVPTSEDGSTVHKLEPQAFFGKKPENIAPEVFRNESFDGFAVDLWAAGVMLYIMLFGNDMMFSAPIPEDPKFQEMCVAGNLKSVVDKFQALVSDQTPVGDEAIDLLQSMLRADPAERLTLAEVQAHPWVTSK